MKGYKQWTAKERRKSHYQTRKAIEKGLIPKPKKCNRCGSTKKLTYHNPDYSDPIKYLEPFCFRCHLKEHREEKTNQLSLWEDKV